MLLFSNIKIYCLDFDKFEKINTQDQKRVIIPTGILFIVYIISILIGI